MRRAALLCCFVLTFAAACGPRYQKALSVSLQSLNAASAGFVEWDADQQKQIVADAKSLEGGTKALADYREKRHVIVEAFTAAYAALALAALEPNVGNLAAAALEAKQLYDALKSLKGGK